VKVQPPLTLICYRQQVVQQAFDMLGCYGFVVGLRLDTDFCCTTCCRLLICRQFVRRVVVRIEAS